MGTSTASDFRGIYEKLLRRVQADDINLRLHGRIQADERFLGGRFHLQHGSMPVITLFRNKAPFSPGRLTDSNIVQILDTAGSDIESELVTLAHEYGHYKSWRRGDRSAEYDHCATEFHNRVDLDSDSCGLIWEEEARAWTRARTLLSELGYANMEYLKRRAEEAEREYRRRLPKLGTPEVRFAM